MIRFCDKEEYVIHLGDMTRSQMLMFFLSENGKHKFDIITVLDENDAFYGIVTYPRLLRIQDEDILVNTDVLCIKNTSSFWKEARAYFEETEEELMPVADLYGEILGFCYEDDDKANAQIENALNQFEKKLQSLPIPFSEWKSRCQAICIQDINELAWRTAGLFRKMGYPVICIGDKWEWFGINTMNDINAYPEYAKFYLYAEGTAHFREEHSSFLNYGSVASQFFVIAREWATANMKAVYEDAALMLAGKGISVCIGYLPLFRDIRYFTALEKDVFFEASESNYEKILGNKWSSVIASRKRVPVSDRMGWKKLGFNRFNGHCLDGITFKKRIYLIGPCIVGGLYCDTEDTLVSYLQKLVNSEEYQVVKIVITWESFVMASELGQIPIRKHDIVIFLEGDDMLKDISDVPRVDLTDIFNDPLRDTWLYDRDPRHVNKNANRAIAEELFDKYLSSEITLKNKLLDGRTFLQRGEVLSEEHKTEVQNYADRIKVSVNAGSQIGCIVMNCNPFTLGHQYLIEYAAGHVDMLYIFVVEEDRSFFAFKDRMEMVKSGTCHLENVVVVPSSRWVLSYDTMPIYFEKSERKEETVDAGMDLEIFARYVAPALDISIRFVGEEPEDPITRQYNEQMKCILGDFGIDVKEVPRKTTEGAVISASTVRSLMKENKWDKILQYVPESTYEYITHMK